MLNEIRTGPVQSADGSVNPARSTREGALVIGAGLADYQELAIRGMLVQAANQSATTTSAGLTQTQLGFCLSNPAGSGKYLIPLLCGLAIHGAPAALSDFGLQGGFLAAGVVTHTTPLVPICTNLSSPGGGVGKADAACTTVGTSLILMPFGTTPITGATAQVVNPPVIGNMYDLKGSIIIPPGGWVAEYTSTALSTVFGMIWAEIPIL